MSTEQPLALGVPAELIEAVARRTAELLAAELDAARAAREEPWLDPKQAAAYLACPRKRVYDLVAQRRVQVARDGDRLLFRRAWLDAALDVTPGGDE